jgi:hypothetical protein
MAGKISMVSLVFCFLIKQNSEAQLLEPQNKEHTITTSAGFDYTLIALSLGYSYYIPKYKTAAFANLTQSSALLGKGNYRLQAGMQSWQGGYKKFMLKSSLALVYSRSVNNAGKFNALGLDVNINPGFIFKKYALGLDLEYNPFFATHIQHSALWKENYYNSKDGWYSTTAQNIRAGVFANKQFGKQYALIVRVGYQSNGQYDKLTPNLYFIAGLSRSF